MGTNPRVAPPVTPSLRVVLIYHPPQRAWLKFTHPHRTLVVHHLDGVMPALRAVDRALARGFYAAGFVAYEAGPAFDPGIAAKTLRRFPLLAFGIFSSPTGFRSLPRFSHNEIADPEPLPWRANLSERDYRQRIRRIRDLIRRGHTYQVNYTLRLRAPAPRDPWSLFCRLVAAQEAPYAAWLDLGRWVIASASPELFFRRQGARIISRPMKGTAPRGLWFEQDEERAKALRQSPKDRAENVMIVDMVRHDLGRIAEPGSVKVPSLYDVERYPTVWQMTSTVEARTRAPLSRLFEALFPPASITGAPKCRTTEIIAQLETAPRRIYTGTIGFASPRREAQFNVAIRTVLIDRQEDVAEYGVGGGIVWDSIAESEYRECLVKARVLSRVQPEFDLLETLLWRPRTGYRFLAAHLRRMTQSARYFRFAFDATRALQRLRAVAAGLAPQPHRVRLLASRRGGLRCEAVPLPEGPPPFGALAPALTPVDSSNPFLYHKTTHRAVYEQALRERPGFGDVLLFNERGEITETTVANGAVNIEGTLYTPPLRCGLLPGVYRAWLLARGRLRERALTLEDVRAHPRIRLFNSVRGMGPEVEVRIDPVTNLAASGTKPPVPPTPPSRRAHARRAAERESRFPRPRTDP